MGNQLCRFGHCECKSFINVHSRIEKKLTGFQLLGIIVQVLRRRLHKQTVEGLREKIMRTEDSALTALTLSEQIEKRGEHGWIEPLIEEMGPWLLLQLGDLANLLEVVLKYVSVHTFRYAVNATMRMKCLFVPIVSTNGASHTKPLTHSAFLA